MPLNSASLEAVPADAGPGGTVWRRFCSLPLRLWQYQRERFPVFGHGILIAAFSSSAVSFSWQLRGGRTLPDGASLAVAFISSFLFFLQLRVADEFKDFEEDSCWRPYRPVPRGLVGLGELAAIAGLGGLAQAALASAWSWRLVVLLLVVWGYLALMTKEFFVREWLEGRPITYLWTHMLIIPLADLYATGCDWAPAGALPPDGLLWFLAASFCNGATLELGRKIRAPNDEETGVRTYSVLWGRKRATLAWLGTVGLTAVSAVVAAGPIGFRRPMMVAVALSVLLAAWLARRFVATPSTPSAKALERFSGAWTLVLYFGLGLVPLLLGMAGVRL